MKKKFTKDRFYRRLTAQKHGSVKAYKIMANMRSIFEAANKMCEAAKTAAFEIVAYDQKIKALMNKRYLEQQEELKKGTAYIIHGENTGQRGKPDALDVWLNNSVQITTIR